MEIEHKENQNLSNLPPQSYNLQQEKNNNFLNPLKGGSYYPPNYQFTPNTQCMPEYNPFNIFNSNQSFTSPPLFSNFSNPQPPSQQQTNMPSPSISNTFPFSNPNQNIQQQAFQNPFFEINKNQQTQLYQPFQPPNENFEFIQQNSQVQVQFQPPNIIQNMQSIQNMQNPLQFPQIGQNNFYVQQPQPQQEVYEENKKGTQMQLRAKNKQKEFTQNETNVNDHEEEKNDGEFKEDDEIHGEESESDDEEGEEHKPEEYHEELKNLKEEENTQFDLQEYLKVRDKL